MVWIGQVPFEDIGMTEAGMDLLKELSEDDDYWMRAYGFVRSISGRRLSSLSDSQRGWLSSIILGLDDELYKRGWKL